MIDLASGPLSAAGGKLDSGIASAFSVFNKLVTTSGALDERTKVLVNFSLVVMSRCGPCLANYVKRAQALGISPAELDEAAWCAVAMGGAPVRMFYTEAMQALAGQGRTAVG